MKFFIYLSSFLLLVSGHAQEITSVSSPFAGNGSIAISLQGKVYVNEYGVARSDISGSGTRIFQVMPDGDIKVVSDSVSGAVGNAFDSKENYYFNNGNSYQKSTLTKLSRDGVISEIAEVNGFSGDILIARDEKSVLIPSYTLPVVHEVTTDGQVSEYVRDDRLRGCTGIVYGDNDKLIVSNFSTGVIYEINAEREITELAKVPTVYPQYVVGYITYFENHVYATGYGSNKIYQINMNGEVKELAGDGIRVAKDGTSENCSFVTPNGIEIDSKNRRLLVSQNGNGQPTAIRAIQLR